MITNEHILIVQKRLHSRQLMEKAADELEKFKNTEEQTFAIFGIDEKRPNFRY